MSATRCSVYLIYRIVVVNHKEDKKKQMNILVALVLGLMKVSARIFQLFPVKAVDGEILLSPSNPLPGRPRMPQSFPSVMVKRLHWQAAKEKYLLISVIPWK